MNEEAKDDEFDPLGESKNVEEQTSKKKKMTIKKTKNYMQMINLF